MLPAQSKFLTAKLHLSYAGERGLLAYYARNEETANLFKIDCIDEMKKAAEALGFELVQRVTPPSPGGGRMDVEVDTDA